ncbi:putative nwd2 protein [Mycena venus]|uniref:Putative nwd2 protein n=1 Tax=Mycena venus TaxID=2733690 RepID=A0A8H7CSW9_9AGAR|nr:putative nwd2 protein [Mycena venus]
MSSGHRPPLSVGPFQSGGLLPPTPQFLPHNHSPLNPSGQASSSDTTVENQYSPCKQHSADFESSTSHSVEPNPSHSMNNSSFPWNRVGGAPTTSINGGTFIGGNVNNIQHGVMGLHILHSVIAADAFHDSAERYPQPRCHPKTRTKLLDILRNWACGIEPSTNWTYHLDDEDREPPTSQDNKSSSGILWLYGPAGAGKSAVAQSLCQELKKEGRLGGSFFFKRGHQSRGNAKRLFPTLAYQLALLLPEVQQLISQTIERDPAIVDRSLSDQLHELIIKPCRKCSLSPPVSIIIDGLDECEGKHIQQELLRLICNAVSREDLPILFLIASRPESHLRETFAEPGLDKFHRPLNIEQSFQDVHTYLLAEFGRIHREHQTTMARVPSPWPRSQILKDLVEKSSGYFIYASTVIKFIDDKRFRPVERLDIILGIKNSIATSPFDTLDQLYYQILCGVPIEFQPQLLVIFATITARLGLSIEKIERILELERGDIRLILRELHSVIAMPKEDYSQVSVHHASFLDFLDDPLRSGQFCVVASCRTLLAYHILKTFSYKFGDRDFDAWSIGVDRAIKYITSTEPSSDLLPLVQSMNPDFLFCFAEQQESADFLCWLKKFNPRSEGLIRLWEDFTFMLLCDMVWRSTVSTEEQESNTCHDILVQTSPQLIRILYASRIIPYAEDTYVPGILFRIHFLLGVSWDDLSAAICPLRRIVGQEWAQLQRLVTCNLDETFFTRADSNSILMELATGALRVFKAMVVDGRNQAVIFVTVTRGWGFFLRACPFSPDLLQSLSEIEAAPIGQNHRGYSEDLHSVLQWLKAFHRPSQFRLPGEGVDGLV